MSQDKIKVRDRRGDNRYFIDNVFLKRWGAKLGPHCIAVYNALVMYSNADDQTSYPSFQTIADLTGMSRRQAVREIEKLKANNIIQAKRRKEVHPETGKPYFLTDIFTLLHPDEWKGSDDNQCIHEPSATQSLPLGTDSHQASDSESLPLVTESHLNNTNLNNTQLTTKERTQEHRPPTSDKHQKPKTIPICKIFVEETKKNCLTPAQAEVIQKEVGTDPAALQRWRESVRAWSLAGNKLTDGVGLLDWFRTGKRSNYDPGKYKNGNHKNDPAPPVVTLTPDKAEVYYQLAAAHLPAARQKE